jgi:polyisoprenoid-binding protein YceI
MKKTMIIVLMAMLPFITDAQKYITKTGDISFFSSAPLENITADNKQVNAAIDLGTGDFVFKVLMKSFEFEKAMMQEHFNENYVESDTYPNASFVGKVTDYSSLNPSVNGPVNISVTGDLTIKGVTKSITETGTIEVKDGALVCNSKFSISLKDFNISIPSTVINNISDTIEITVNVTLNKLAQ